MLSVLRPYVYREKPEANNIRKYRKLRKYSIKELACIVGVSANSIHAWETSKMKIPQNRLEQIAVVLDVKVSELTEL